MNPDQNVLPGVFALVRSGRSIYKQHRKVISSIALTQAALMLVFTLGMSAVGYTITAKSIGLGLGIGAFVAFVLYIVLIMWLSFALVHAIRGAPEGISYGEAFRRATGQFWSLIWVGLLTFLMVLGGLTLFSVLPAALLFFAGLKALAVFVGIVAALASMLVFGAWLAFSNFAVIDGVARGTNAIVTSRGLVAGRFWAVLGRIAGVGLLIGLAAVVIALFAVLISLVFPHSLQADVVRLISQIGNLLIVTPIAIGAMYTLYMSLRGPIPPPAAPSSFRKWVVGLAIVGVLGVIALPIGGIVFIATLIGNRIPSGAGSVTSQQPEVQDAERKVQINTLELALEIYNSQHNAYPDALTSLSSSYSGANSYLDPVTHQSFVYQVGADRKSYKLCATLSTLQDYCVQYPVLK